MLHNPDDIDVPRQHYGRQRTGPVPQRFIIILLPFEANCTMNYVHKTLSDLLDSLRHYTGYHQGYAKRS